MSSLSEVTMQGLLWANKAYLPTDRTASPASCRNGVLAWVSGKMFQPLGDGADALGCVLVENVEGRLGVDEQGGGGAVDAGDGLVAVHG